MFMKGNSMTTLTLPDTLPITIDPELMSGAPVFRHTRVTVQTLFDYILDGCTLEQFLDNFPTVRREDAVIVLDDLKFWFCRLKGNTDKRR